MTPEVAARVRAVREWCDAGPPISDTDRAVLRYAADVAEQHDTLTPAMPKLRVMAGTGLGEKSVRNALRRLEHDGLLSMARRGRPSGANVRWRMASLYGLPTDERLAAGPRSREAAAADALRAEAAQAVQGASPEEILRVLAVLRAVPDDPRVVSLADYRDDPKTQR